MWAKMGDLLLNTQIKQTITQRIQTLTNNYPLLENALLSGFFERYRFRYLFVNKYDVWLQQFTNKLDALEPEFNLRASAYLKLNSDWVLLNNKLTTTTETTNTGTKTTTDSRTTTTTTTDTRRNTMKIDKDGTETDAISNTDTTTLNTNVANTGTDSNATTTIDNTITTVTNDTTDGQLGVKTTHNTPSADTVTKTITTNITPPMNASSAISGGGETPSIHADNINSETPFETDGTGYISGAVENVTYTNLQRDSNGNYRYNETVETYGSLSETTGLWDSLKTTHSGTVTTAVSRPDEIEYNTETGSTNTYNTNQATTGTNKLVSSGNNTKTYDTEDTHSYTGNDDATHNLKNATVNGGNIAESNTGTGETIAETTGFTVDRSILYQNFLDAINKSDFVKWFVGSFWELFSVSYEMDDREMFELNEYVFE